MYPIASPGATVDNKFTEGDPVGGVPATVVSAKWMNDVQAEILSVLTAANIAPSTAVQNQLLAAIRMVQSGLTGSTRRGRMNIAVAGSSASYTADEVVVKTALGSASWLLGAFNKTINLAAVGVGGMDTGAAPANGYVAIYAIFNPTSGVSALLAVNATATVVPEVYGGANMPAGYTYSALLTVLGTNGSAQLRPAQVKDRRVSFPAIFTVGTNTVAANVTTGISASVPPNAIECSGFLSYASPNAGSLSITMSGDAANSGAQQMGGTVPATTPQGQNFSGIPILTPSTIIVSTSNATAGTPTWLIYFSGYNI